MMSFKYGLIFLRYSSTDSVLFLSPLLSYPLLLLLQKLLTLTGLVCNNFLFFFSYSKRFLISFSILSLIALVYFS